MDLEDIEIKPNSHKYKEAQKKEAEAKNSEEHRIEPSLSGKVVPKKKSEIRKFFDMFVSEDIGDVKSFIVQEIILPAFKNTVSDIFSKGVDMILYGSSSVKKKSGSSNYISYRDFSDSPGRNERQRKATTGIEFDDIVYNTYAEADEAIQKLIEVFDRYSYVTVADIYDLNKSTAPFTAQKYGWTSKSAIVNADIKRTRDGYIVVLPKARPLD